MLLLLMIFSFGIRSADRLRVPCCSVCLSETLADQQLSQVPTASLFPFQAPCVFMPEIQKLCPKNMKNCSSMFGSVRVQTPGFQSYSYLAMQVSSLLVFCFSLY